MTITSIEVYKFPIPIDPFVIATGTMFFAQNILIKIYTDSGIIGYGECSAFPMIVGETQATCFEMAKDFAVIWKGKNPLEIDIRLKELDIYAYANYTIKSAFDMALYDIAAKNAELPLYKFLGGNLREIKTDVTIGIDTPDNMAEKAKDFENQGFDIIKIKLGKIPDEDIERIKAIRSILHTTTQIRIDANQGWDFSTAKKMLKTLAEYNIQFCEQPMRKYLDYKLPELVRTSPIPIMADESVFTHYDAERILSQNAAKYVNIKLAKSGGIHEAIKINEVAQSFGIQCMLGCMMESRLALAANLHLAIATPNIQYFDLDTALLGQSEDPVIGGIKYTGPFITILETPGIGAEIEQSFLDKQEHWKI